MSTTTSENSTSVINLADGSTIYLEDDYAVTDHVVGENVTLQTPGTDYDVIINAGGILELLNSEIELSNKNNSNLTGVVQVKTGGTFLLSNSSLQAGLNIAEQGQASISGTEYGGNITCKGTLTLNNVNGGGDVTCTGNGWGDEIIYSYLTITDSSMTAYDELWGVEYEADIQMNEFTYLRAENSVLGSIGTGMGLFVNDVARGKYTITNCEIRGSLCVTHASDMASSSGNTFTGTHIFMLPNFSGSTADLWSGGFTVTKEKSYISIGASIGNDSGKKVILNRTPDLINGGYGSGGYVFDSLLGVTVPSEHEFVMEDGVCADMNGSGLTVQGKFQAIYSQVADALICRPGQVSNSNNNIRVESGGSFEAVNANITLQGDNGGHVEVVFDGEFSMTGGTLSLVGKLTATRLDRDHTGVINLNGTRLTHPNAENPEFILAASGVYIGGTGVINLKNLSIGTGATIEAVDCQTDWEYETGWEHNGTRITIENSVIEKWARIEVEAGGNLTMKNCVFESDADNPSVIVLEGGYDNNITINGCDLSGVDIQVECVAAGSTMNLSGNYWGTTDMDEIKAKFSGVDTSLIVLDSILTEPPVKADLAGPVVTTNVPYAKMLAPGLNDVTLSWTANEEVVLYEVFLDSDLVYTGTNTSCHVSVPDRDFNYTIRATDKAGNVSVTQALAPGVALNEPISRVYTEYNEDTILVSLSWAPPVDEQNSILAGDNYIVAFKYASTGEEVVLYQGSNMSHQFYGPKGLEGDILLGVVDSYGNTLIKSIESFRFEGPAAPEPLKLLPPKINSFDETESSVTLSWSGGGTNATYTLLVDGEEAYTGTGKSCTLTLPTGRHEYKVIAEDAFGQSSELSANFFCGAVAPEYSITKRSGGKATVTLTWEGDTGFTYELVIGGKTHKLGKENSWQGTLPDGEHSYTFITIDADGNRMEQDGTLSFDATAPELLLTSAALSKDGAMSWQSNEAATYTLQVDEDAPIELGTATSYVPEGLKEGKHNYTVTAVDAEGNAATAKGSFTLDTTAPKLTLKAPVMKKLGENESSITLSWTGEKDAVYELTVEGTTAEGEPYSETFSGLTGTKQVLTLPDGHYSYSLSAADKVGNVSTQAGSFAADTSAPEVVVAPVSFTGAAQMPGKGSLVLDWSESPAEEGATYELKVDGKKKKLEAGALGYAEILKDGAHEYSLTVKDAAGNSREQVGSFYLDTTAPKLSVSKPKCVKSAEGQMEVTMKWSGELGATFRVIVDGVQVYEGKDSSCTFLYEDGEHSYEVTSTDAFGNVTTSKVGAMSLDATAPTGVTILSVSDAYDVKKGKGKVDFAWQGEEGLTYTLMVDGKKAWSGKKEACTVTLADGHHTYSLHAKDKAGNITEVWGEQDIVFDATAPVITMDAVEMTGNTATLRWTSNEEGCTSTLTLLDGKTALDLTMGADGLSATTGELEAGKRYSYTLVAVDAAGNESAAKKGTFTMPKDATADTEAPAAVTELRHDIKSGKNGMVSATISWKGEKGATYTLLVDGEIAYVGTATKRSLSLPSGEHEYTVIATDKAGNRGDAASGSFCYEAPTLATSKDYRLTTISWLTDESCTCVLKVNGKVVQHDGDSYEFTAAKDGKQNYVLTVESAEGILNYNGSFEVDTTEPKVKLGKVSCVKAGEGLMTATLNWSGEKNALYELSIDEGEVIMVEGGDKAAASFTLRGLTDGTHRWRVIAVDAAGNRGLEANGSFSYDATAPDIILGGIAGTAVTSKGVTRSQVSFDWVGEDGVSYTVMVDGKKLGVKKLTEKQQVGNKTITVTTSTLSATTGNIAAGEHHYSIVAKDKAGNVSEFTGTFVTDAEGNASWGADSPIDALPAGTHALSWGGENTEGFFITSEMPAAGYSFELTEARQLLVKLSGLAEEALVELHQVGGQGSISLRANAATGLDHELTLSAGTYYMRVLDANGISPLAGGCMLDIELEKNGKSQPMQQAQLALR